MLNLLNKLAIISGMTEFSARWYFWDGGFLAVGRSRGVVPTHAHHAFQLVVATEGTNKLSHADGDWQQFEAAIVAADEPHAYDGEGVLGAMLLIDPETREGRWLRQSMKQPVQAMLSSRVEPTRELVREFIHNPPDADGTAEFVSSIVKCFGTGIMPTRALDERVAKAIDVVQGMDTKVVSLDAIASQVFLSASRFAHLFSDEVGIPFRRYLLWRRLTRGLVGRP